MQISIDELKNKTHHSFVEEISFDEESLKKIDLLKQIKKLIARVDLEICNPFIIAKIKLQGDLILLSSRSLKELPYSFEDEISLTFALYKMEDEDDDVIYVENRIIDFTPYLYSLLNANIPFKVLADEDKETIVDDSWELISEDEYYERKKDKPNGLFDALKDFGE